MEGAVESWLSHELNLEGGTEAGRPAGLCFCCCINSSAFEAQPGVGAGGRGGQGSALCPLLIVSCLFRLQALRSFKLSVTVDPKYHPKIIGRKGAVITQIRLEHDVNIQFPDKDDGSQVRMAVQVGRQVEHGSRWTLAGFCPDLGTVTRQTRMCPDELWRAEVSWQVSEALIWTRGPPGLCQPSEGFRACGCGPAAVCPPLLPRNPPVLSPATAFTAPQAQPPPSTALHGGEPRVCAQSPPWCTAECPEALCWNLLAGQQLLIGPWSLWPRLPWVCARGLLAGCAFLPSWVCRSKVTHLPLTWVPKERESASSLPRAVPLRHPGPRLSLHSACLSTEYVCTAIHSNFNFSLSYLRV